MRRALRQKACSDLGKSQVIWDASESLRRPDLHSRAYRSREELLSPKVSLLACVILAASLFLAIDHATMSDQELNSQFLPRLSSGNIDVNRPIGMCVARGSVAIGHHGSGNCPFNFSVSLSQENLMQLQGSSSSIRLSVTLVSGVSVPVTLSAQGAPAATGIMFTPASAKPSFSSTMTIVTSPGTPLGQFNITVVATGGGLERSASLSLLVVPIVHEVTVVSARVQERASVGSIVWINATVANYGSLSEAFEIRAYANTTLVANQSPPELAPTATLVGRVMWNTTGFSPGTYTILVAVPPVKGELNILDNTREAGKILLTQTPGSGPSPSPAASGGNGQGFVYGRQLAIVAAIAEAAIVLLLVLRRKGNGRIGNPSAGPRKI